VGVQASLASSSLSVEPGKSADVTLTVHNSGSVVDRFTFEALGPVAPWLSFVPDTLSLFPDTSGTIKVVVSPPKSHEIQAGTAPFGVKVLSQEDPEASVAEEGTLAVGAFSDVGAELLPRIVHGRRVGAARMAVDNRSNVPYDGELSAIDPSDALRFAFRPAIVSVPPGGAAFVRVRIQPRKTFWKGPDTNKPFHLSLTSTMDPHPARIPVDGSLLQSALVPKWVLRLIALLIALAVLFVILWFLLLRPQIKSAAKSEVKNQLAQAGLASTPTQGSPTSGSGGTSGTGSSGTSSTAGNSSSSAAPAPAAGSITINRSATANGNSSQVLYTVPTGFNLEVTDVLVQNAAGDNGTIALAKGGATLMQWSMADFRDLDYHWISPTIFGPGSTVVMQVSGCTNACHPGIYYAGNLVKSS
jgi:hypothetical protein